MQIIPLLLKYAPKFYVLLTVHPSIVCFKWSQLGAHNFLVYLFQLLHMFLATMCPSSGEFTPSTRHWYFSLRMGCCLYRALVGKPEGRRPLGRSKRRWADNIRVDLQEVGCGYMDWIGLAQDRDKWRTLVSAVMNPRVPWNAGNFLTSCKPVSFSRRTLHHGVSKRGWLFGMLK